MLLDYLNTHYTVVKHDIVGKVFTATLQVEGTMVNIFISRTPWHFKMGSCRAQVGQHKLRKRNFFDTTAVHITPTELTRIIHAQLPHTCWHTYMDTLFGDTQIDDIVKLGDREYIRISYNVMYAWKLYTLVV